MNLKVLISFIFSLVVIGCFPKRPDHNGQIDKNFVIYKTSQHQIGVMAYSGAAKIPPKIVEIGWDKAFIIAKRQALNGNAYQEPVKGAYDYWIIDISSRKAFGPLSELDFKEMKSKLGVSQDIEMLPY